ncbi:hypothetical protein [Dyadobacter sp. 676]|uniref:Uncharacterized protein n=1 Tax=Dyadobacter sp. 676 TaxID=3088362 RepID=A0AAU8FE95_9BACT
MKTYKASKVAVIKNSHTSEEKREIEEQLTQADTLKFSLKDLLQSQPAKKAKA